MMNNRHSQIFTLAINEKSLNRGMKYSCEIRNLQYLFDLCTQFQFSFPVSLKQLGRKVEIMMFIYHHNHVTMVTITNNVNNVAVILLSFFFVQVRNGMAIIRCVQLLHILYMIHDFNLMKGRLEAFPRLSCLQSFHQYSWASLFFDLVKVTVLMIQKSA